LLCRCRDFGEALDFGSLVTCNCVHCTGD
jgi:hypothetical protein